MSDDAVTYLRRLLAIIDRDGGYRKPEDQATIRGARRLLAELTAPPSNGHRK